MSSPRIWPSDPRSRSGSPRTPRLFDGRGYDAHGYGNRPRTTPSEPDHYADWRGSSHTGGGVVQGYTQHHAGSDGSSRRVSSTGSDAAAYGHPIKPLPHQYGARSPHSPNRAPLSHRSERGRGPLRHHRRTQSASSSSSSSSSPSSSSRGSTASSSDNSSLASVRGGARAAYHPSGVNHSGSPTAQVRWVAEGQSTAAGRPSRRSLAQSNEGPTWEHHSRSYMDPQQPVLERTGYGRASQGAPLQRIFSPPPSPNGGLSALRPSPLLVEVVRSVAYYRNAPCPQEIYPEVVLAFDEYLARGVTLKKFIPNGPPHDRFFAIRFLDLQHRRVDRDTAVRQPVPEAVFCWYRTAKSRNMRRYFPLVDLYAVRRGGEGHPYIERRKTRAPSAVAATTEDVDVGNEVAAYAHNNNTEDNFMLLKNGKKGIFGKYINDSYVLQLAFRSLLSHSEEVVAVQAPNPTVLLALHVVADYISRIGRDL